LICSPSEDTISMRRKLEIGVIAFWALLGAAGGPAAWAAEDRATVAQREARKASESWLATLDQGKYGTSWETAAALFRESVPREAWIRYLRENREPLGAVQSRTLEADDYATNLPGAPTGQYVTLRFGTVFEKGVSRIETLVLAPEAGTWRVLGYHATGSLSPEQLAADQDAGRQAALTWLALEDRGGYGEAWDAAATAAQRAVPRAMWVNRMEQARRPLGAVQSRIFKAAEYSTTVPGAPPGEYVTVRYDTVFANRGASNEIVTLRREGRDWRVVGYLFP
jgi:hypothetical protein